MDVAQFREFGKTMVDYIADYWETLENRNALARVEPGYLINLVLPEAQSKGEHWRDIFTDVDRVIMPGLTHWQSPNFHAYFPLGHSFPSVVGELLSAGIGNTCIDWKASPASTELEMKMIHWLGKLFGLPNCFLNSEQGHGGGIIQGSVTETILIALSAAKEKKVQLLSGKHSALNSNEVIKKLVVYTSDQGNCCIEKSTLICSVTVVHLKSINCKLTGKTLRKAIRNDKEKGLIPCAVVATVGTTGTCAFDDLEELGQICRDENVWLHVDAAFAGSALACPEYRYLIKGIELCDSLNISLHKWMLVNIDCTPMWVKDKRYLVNALAAESRFRSLKVWFVLRSYGVEGIQKYIRNHISLARYFEKLMRSDSRFEVCSSFLALVCFRLKGDNNCDTQLLLDKIHADKKYYFTPYIMEGKFVIRFAVCSRLTDKVHIHNVWKAIISYVE